MRITDIQTFCLHDGPGIRTVIFFAGCPLACPWCHNPEARVGGTRLVYDAERCIGCLRCAPACPQGAHAVRDGVHTLVRADCTACLACTAACPAGALTPNARPLTEEELFAVAERQARLCGKDGGITLSGGEPLLYGEELLPLIPRLGVHVAIETSGYADADLFRRVVSAVNYVMLDIKLADDAAHRRYTGVSNRPILENLAILREVGTPFMLRTPLIPGVSDTEENLAAIRAIVGGDPWEALPYNPLAKKKHERLGLPYPDLR